MVKLKPTIRGNKSSIQKSTEKSRERSISIRKNTLLQEYQNRFKSGSFIDKRIGEHDSTPLEDKLLERFTKEKQRKIGKKAIAIYNNPEEDDYGGFVLTHRGQEISNTETKNSIYSDFDDISESGNVSEEDMALDRENVSKHHFVGFDRKPKAEIMQEIISKSKYYKMERQKLSEENNQLSASLNDTFDTINSLLPITKIQDSIAISNNHNDYDTFIREFSSETRQAKASNRLKTHLELDLQEKERIEMLKNQITQEYYVPLESSDSRPVNEFHLPQKHRNEISITISNSNSLDAIANELFSTPKSTPNDHSSSNDEDIESDVYEFEDYSEDDNIEHAIIPVDQVSVANSTLNWSNSPLPSGVIPRSFECPTSLEKWNQLTANTLLCNHDLKLIFSSIKRIYDPSIDRRNIKLLESLVICILEHITIVVDSVHDAFKVKEYINELIYHIEDVIKSIGTEHYNIDSWFSKKLEMMLHIYKDSKRVFMPENASDIVVLHWIGRWYGRAGLPLWNSASLVIGMILQQVSKLNKKDVCVGLLLVDIYSKYESRDRLMPEALGFLDAIITNWTSFIDNSVCPNPIFPKRLMLFEWTQYIEFEFSLFSRKINPISEAVSLLEQMIIGATRSNWVAFDEIFSPILKTLLYASDLEPLTTEAQVTLKNIIKTIQKQCKCTREPLQSYKDARPHLLPLLNPKLDADFRKGKHRPASDIVKRHKVLVKNVKRERKGVIRELRRDTRCIKEMKLKEMKQSHHRNRHPGQETHLLY